MGLFGLYGSMFQATDTPSADDTAPKLEDFLSETPGKKNLEEIDVEKMVEESLSNAGVSRDNSSYNIADDVYSDPEEIEITEGEPHSSYFDILCERTSKSNSVDDRDSQGQIYSSIPEYL